MTQSKSTTDSTLAPSKRRLPRWPVRLIALGLGLVIGFFLWRQFTSPPSIPPLTPQKLQDARKLWSAQNISSYRLTIRVKTNDENQLDLEVRNGKVTSMKTSGQQVDRSAQTYWTIPGMFEFLEIELQNKEKRIYGEANAYVDAAFHPKLGYPVSFRRQVFGKPMNASWEVQVFQAY